MHSAAGLDTRSAISLEIQEIARKKGSNRTQADDDRIAGLECQRSLWLDESGTPCIPYGAIRGCIEQAARKLKQGPQVREGLIVDMVEPLSFDKKRYGNSLEEWGKTTQFRVPVVVQRSRIIRTRAKFDTWECVFFVETDPELVDKTQLANWLDIAGRRIGLGDWRPQKSGHYGRFETVSIKED